MKALVKKKPLPNTEWHQGLLYQDMPEAMIKKPNEVKLKVLAAGICGTDVSIYKATQALNNSMANLETDQVITGHEFCGEVNELGEEAKLIIANKLYGREYENQEISDHLKKYNPEELAMSPDYLDFLKKYFYVTAEMHIVCWDCYQCKIGEGHVCGHTYIKGLHKDGCFAEYLTIPAKNIILIPKAEIPLEIVAFMDAIGNAVHTCQSAEMAGKNILVLGAGIQGLMAVAVAKTMGAANVFITDASNPDKGLTPELLNEVKFAAAKKLGADGCFDTASDDGRKELAQAVKGVSSGAGVDVVIEMSGSYHAYKDAFNNLRMGGTLALLGLPSGKMEVDFSKDIIFKGLIIKGIIGRRVFETWELMIALLKNGLAELIMKSNIVTHDLPLAEYDSGFQSLMAGKALKVILRP